MSVNDVKEANLPISRAQVNPIVAVGPELPFGVVSCRVAAFPEAAVQAVSQHT